jgi:hypothetical protein
MSNNRLYRFAGWSALLSVILSLALFPLESIGGWALMAASFVPLALGGVVFYALFVFHCPQAGTMSLVMLVSGLLGLILEFLGATPESTMGIVTHAIYGVAFLLVCYLAFGESRMPRWLAVCILIAGASVFVSAVLTALGLNSLAETTGMVYFIAWIVWSVGIWRWFLKTAAA